MSETKQSTASTDQQPATPGDTAVFYAKALPDARAALRNACKSGRASDASIFLDVVQRMEKALATSISDSIVQAVDSELHFRAWVARYIGQTHAQVAEMSPEEVAHWRALYDLGLRERQARRSANAANGGHVPSVEVRVGETGTDCFVPPATSEARDEAMARMMMPQFSATRDGMAFSYTAPAACLYFAGYGAGPARRDAFVAFAEKTSLAIGARGVDASGMEWVLLRHPDAIHAAQEWFAARVKSSGEGAGE